MKPFKNANPTAFSSKRISDAAVQKSTIAPSHCANQRLTRDFDFLGCSAFLAPVLPFLSQSARAEAARSEASTANALGAGRDTPRVIRG
jgi:hypothetical protein